MHHRSHLLVLALMALLAGCGLAPPPLLAVPLGSAVLEMGALQQQGDQGRLSSVKLRVPHGSDFPRSWSFEILLFDDRDGDGRPQPGEFLARRQALGSRPSVVHFPRLRFVGTAVRPHLQLRFRDGRHARARTLALGRPIPAD